MSRFFESDHRHKWVFSRENFWSEHGGDFCLVWCELCPSNEGGADDPMEFPLEIARSLVDFHVGEPVK